MYDSKANPKVRTIVRAYSPIKQHFALDKSKPHAWLEKKDHDDEIRNTLKDMNVQMTRNSSSQQKNLKPTVESFMSPLKTKNRRHTSTDRRIQYFRQDIEKHDSTVVGPDSNVEDESKIWK